MKNKKVVGKSKSGEEKEFTINGPAFTTLQFNGYSCKIKHSDAPLQVKGNRVVAGSSKSTAEWIKIAFRQEFYPEIYCWQNKIKTPANKIRELLEEKVKGENAVIYFDDRPRPQAVKELEKQVDVLETEKSELSREMEAMKKENEKLKAKVK